MNQINSVHPDIQQAVVAADMLSVAAMEYKDLRSGKDKTMEKFINIQFVTVV